jgi:predicted nucleic acid-binding protein
VKILFDTSILVAALLEDHLDSLPWLQRAIAKEIQGVVSTHTLAELYAILT